jgi:hypothetical protein
MAGCTIFRQDSGQDSKARGERLGEYAGWKTGGSLMVFEYGGLRHSRTRGANIEFVLWNSVTSWGVTRCTNVALSNHAVSRSKFFLRM